MNQPAGPPRIAVSGFGAVSPAGWGADALIDAVSAGAPLPVAPLERPGCDVPIPVRRVPAADSPAAALRHPRLRRASPISRFAVAAVHEAVGDAVLEASRAGTRRIGVVCALMNACVNFSNRFYGEVLRDPSLASPIVFPETVFNAPSSHVSSFLGSTAPNDTLVGDSAAFLPALDLAVMWLLNGDVDGCVVVGAEELDWLSAAGLRLFQRDAIASEGAGAIFLECVMPGDPTPDVELAFLTDVYSFTPGRSPEAAAKAVRSALEESASADAADDLLVDSQSGSIRLDRAERLAWAGSPQAGGSRWHPLRVLGHAMGATSALQCVCAAAAVKRGQSRSAIVAATGLNQQAAGLRFRQGAVHP